MVLHKDYTWQLELWRWRQSHLAASQGEQAPFSGKLHSGIFSYKSLSDAVSIQLTGLQDTSLQLLLGNVTDMCGALAESERPARVAEELVAGSRRGARHCRECWFRFREHRARPGELAALLPKLELLMCIAGQVISSFASNNIIMTITSAAINCRTNFSNPKPNTEGGWTPDRAELLQPFLAGCEVQFISFPRGVQADTLTSATVRAVWTIHWAMWWLGVSPWKYPLSEGVEKWSPALGCTRLSAVHIRERCKVICSTPLYSTSRGMLWSQWAKINDSDIPWNRFSRGVSPNW